MKVIHVSCLSGVPDFSVLVYGTFLIGNGIEYNFIHPLWKNRDDIRKADVFLMEVSNLYFSKIKLFCNKVKEINPKIRIILHGPLLKYFKNVDFADGLIEHFNPCEMMDILENKRERTTRNVKRYKWKIGENEVIRLWFKKKFLNPYTSKPDLLLMTANGCSKGCKKCGIYDSFFEYDDEIIDYVFWWYKKLYKDKEVIVSDVTPNVQMERLQNVSRKWKWKVFSDNINEWKEIKEKFNLLFISSSFSEEKLEYAIQNKIPVKLNVDFSEVKHEDIIRFQEITRKYKNVHFELIHFVDVCSLENESDVYSANLLISNGKFSTVLSRSMSYEKYFNRLLKQISEV